MPTLVRYWGSHLKSARQARRVRAYFERTAAAGWRTCLVCSREPADRAWLAPLEDLGVEIVYLPRARGNFDRRCILAAMALCRRVRGDVLHCDNTHTSPLIGAWLAGVPVRVWTKHSMEPAFEAGRAPTLRDRAALSLRLSCRLATRVLPVSGAVGRELVAKGIPAGKVSVMHLPLEPAAGGGADPAAARRRFGMGAGEVVFTTVGRAEPVKGWDVLLKAFAAASRSAPQARLLLAGDAAPGSAFRGVLDALIERHALQARVRLLGHVAEIGELLAATDVFVLPSRSEGHSLALAEARRAGLVCVASRVGAAGELVRDGVDGFLVEREDHGTLAERLVRLALHGELRGRLRTAAAAAPAPAPTLEEHAAALHELYASLLEAPRRSALAAAS